MKAQLRKPRKIIILFIIGIGLPSLILGYLAFRGIRNDQALMERDQLNSHRELAQQVISAVSDSLEVVKSSFLRPIVDDTARSPAKLNEILHRFKLRYPAVEEPFSFDNRYSIKFPTATLLYLEDDSIRPSSAFLPLLNRDDIRRGQELEFQKSDFNEALRSYRNALKNLKSNPLKWRILHSIARVHGRAGNYPQAIATYQQIVERIGNTQSEGDSYLLMAARIELDRLYASSLDTVNAFSNLLSGYSDLLGNRLKLSKSQFDFFSSKIRQRIAQIVADSKSGETYGIQRFEAASLRQKEKYLRRSTERLYMFKQGFQDELKAIIGSIPNATQTEWRYFVSTTGRYPQFVVFLDRQISDRYWGILFDPDSLTIHCLQRIVKNVVDLSKAGLVIKDKDERIVYTTGQYKPELRTVQANFNTFPPSWVLELYRPESLPIEQILFSHRSIYLIMFLLIGTILVFGLVLSVRVVTHELDLARMKSDFVSTISHEFKSPLTSIRQISEMLRDGRISSDNRRHKYYDILLDQSERLTLLIDNVLDFSKLEVGKKTFQYEEVNTTAFFSDLFTKLNPRIQHQGFSVDIKIEPDLPTIAIDGSAITQAVSNLMDNAVKFSDDRKEIVCHVFGEGEALIISVQDFGIGIQTKDIDKIFERFYRGGDEMTRSVKGSGLGLTIVKQVVDAHEGVLKVSSQPGKGSQFRITLPVQSNR
ncbi:hypothetical protein BVY01_02325 [bacterium I07]|nr:hypothetical protein BVY01_02325 [bacterium I07]